MEVSVCRGIFLQITSRALSVWALKNNHRFNVIFLPHPYRNSKKIAITLALFVIHESTYFFKLYTTFYYESVST